MHKEKQAQVHLNHDKIQRHSETRLFPFAYILDFENEISQRKFSPPLKDVWGQSLSPVESHHVPLRVAQWDLSYSDYSVN